MSRAMLAALLVAEALPAGVTAASMRTRTRTKGWDEDSSILELPDVPDVMGSAMDAANGLTSQVGQLADELVKAEAAKREERENQLNKKRLQIQELATQVNEVASEVQNKSRNSMAIRSHAFELRRDNKALLATFRHLGHKVSFALGVISDAIDSNGSKISRADWFGIAALEENTTRHAGNSHRTAEDHKTKKSGESLLAVSSALSAVRHSQDGPDADDTIDLSLNANADAGGEKSQVADNVATLVTGFDGLVQAQAASEAKLEAAYDKIDQDLEAEKDYLQQKLHSYIRVRTKHEHFQNKLDKAVTHLAETNRGLNNIFYKLQLVALRVAQPYTATGVF